MGAVAKLAVIVGPEYRPTDPYPPGFSSYDEYFDGEIQGAGYRRLIEHDPAIGSTSVRRFKFAHSALAQLEFGTIAWPGADYAIPLSSGCAFVSRIGGRMKLVYAQYAADDELEPEPETLLDEVDDLEALHVACDGRRVGLLRLFRVEDATPAQLWVVTPSPVPGEQVLAVMGLPNITGDAGSMYRANITLELLLGNLKIYSRIGYV